MRCDDVLQAFEMLDVERGPDVDAVAQDLLDVLVALGVDQARRVRMRELVDEQQLRRRAIAASTSNSISVRRR